MFKLFKKDIQEEPKEELYNIFQNVNILDKKSYLREIEFLNKPNIKLDLLEQI